MLSEEDMRSLEDLETQLNLKKEKIREKEQLIQFLRGMVDITEEHCVMAYMDRVAPHRDHAFVLPVGTWRPEWVKDIVKKHFQACIEEIQKEVGERLRS